MKGVQGFFSRFLSIFSAKVITTIVAIISTPIIVRLLGPGGYGDYAVLLSVFSLYMIPVSSGFTAGIQKFVAEKRPHDDWAELVVRFYTMLAIAVVVVAALVLLVVTAIGVPARVFGEQFTTYFFLLTVFVIAAQFRSLFYHAILGFGLEYISESLNVLKKIGNVVIGIALVLLGYGVAGMLAGLIIANVVITFIAMGIIVRRLSVRGLRRSPPADFPRRELISFNGLNIVLVLLVMSLFHIDIIMLQAFTGSETTGFYKAALQLAEYMWLAPMAVQLLLLHSTSTLWSDGEYETITDIATRVTRYTLLFVGLLAIGLATLSHRFVPLYYGSAFTVSIWPLLLLLPGAIGFAAARPLQAISQGSGKMKTLILATSVAAGGNLVLNGLLIPSYGMHGAAVATSISYGSMFGLFVWAAWRIGYDPLEDFRGTRVAATILITLPLLVAIDRSIGHDIVALLTVPLIGALIYCIAAMWTGALDWSEVDAVLEKLPDPIGSVLQFYRS